MPEVNIWAIAVAVVAGFVFSSLYYTVFGKQYAKLSKAARDSAGMKPEPVKLVLELVRTLIVTAVLTGLAANLGITTLGGALGLGLALWAGFPAVLLAGAVYWEGEPVPLAVLHAGDWLGKLLLITCIVSLWR